MSSAAASSDDRGDSTGPQPTADDHPASDNFQTLLETEADRRTLLRGIGAAGTATVGIGAASSTVAADPRTDPESGSTGVFYSAGEAAAGAMYDAFDSFFSSGIDPDEAAEQEATNLHWEIYDSADSVHRQVDGFLTEMKNFVQPSDPTSGPLETMVWSEIRSKAFKGVEEGWSQGDTVQEARDAAQEYIATRETNVLRQWNELVADWIRWLLMFDDDWDEDEEEQATEWDDDVSDYELGTDGIEWNTSWEHQSGELEAGDWMGDDNDNSVTQEDGVEVHEFELANGETQEYYNWTYYSRSASGGSGIDEVNPIDVDGRADRYLIVSPDGDEIPYFGLVEDFGEVMDAIEEVRSDMSGEIGDYVEEVYDAHESGDIESYDILGGTELAREFSDSDGFDRVAGEMMALGLAPPETGEEVTIELESGTERTGHLFVNYSYDYVPEYAYEFDTDDSTLRIDADYFMPDAAWFLDLEDGDDDYEYTAESSDFDEDGDDRVLELDESRFDDDLDLDADDYDLTTLENEARGELRAFVPEGETITEEMHSHTMLAHEDSDGDVTRTSIGGDEEYTLVDAGSDDRLVLSSYNQQTRDPSMALDQAEAQSDNRETVSELEEVEVTLPGVPGFDDVDGSAIAGFAVIGVVILGAVAVVTDFVTDLLPWT